MTLRTYSYDPEDPQTLRDYEVIRAWAPERFPVPELLPKLGVIVEDGEEAICFLCADMSNSIPRAMIDYLMTNPKVGALKRWEAAFMAEEFLCERLKGHGYVVVYGISRLPGVASLAQELGYQVSPKPVIEFRKELS